jgi:hypothetical protein
MSHRRLLLALLLPLAACGSSTATTATTTAPTAAPATSASVAASQTTAVAGGSSAPSDSGAPTVSLDTVISGFGLTPSAELTNCLQGRGVEAEISSNGQVNKITTALMACAPEDMGAYLATDLDVPGLEHAQVECVVVETLRVVGGLGEDDAATALSSDNIPESVRTVVVANAGKACGLNAAQIDSVLAAQ